jgi:ParB/RepB/Spo0J family partition protein
MSEYEAINNIPLEEIVPSGHNRTIGGFDQVKLQELAESIKAIGVQQPAVVRPKGDKYELVAGERRWRASKLAGVATLPCVIRDLDDETALRIQIIENLQREEIHPLDEADGFKRLEEEGHCEVEYIAQQVGRSTAYVYQRLKLLDLIADAQDLLADGTISVGHALLIARLPRIQQKDALDLAFRGGLEDKDRETCSVKDLDSSIKRNILLELSSSTWKVDDAKLYPAAGSCKLCPKRTGANPLLFSEAEVLGKHDSCTDPECFEMKGQLMIKRRREELKDEKYVEVSDSYRGRQSLEKGVLDSYDWHECKKKDPGATRILVVAGDSPGRVTWGIIPKSSLDLDPDEKARRKAEKAREKLLNDTEEKLKLSIYSQAKHILSGNLLMDPAAKKAILKIFWDRMEHESKINICKVEGWEIPRIKGKYDPPAGHLDYNKAFEQHMAAQEEIDFLQELVTIALAGRVKSNGNYSRGIDKNFRAAALAAGLDVDALIASAAESAGLTVQELNPKNNFGDEEDGGEDEEEQA